MDLQRAKEVLSHLLENANLYSAKQQPIVVSAENNGNVVTLSVADRGPGIDTLEQGLIFDKFYRGRDQRTMIQGTGLKMGAVNGLSIGFSVTKYALDEEQKLREILAVDLSEVSIVDTPR